MEPPTDLTKQATQSGFALLVGTSQPAIAKHVQNGTLKPGESYKSWILAYIKRLREEAAGRTVSSARERRDNAQADQAEVDAALKRIELLRNHEMILDVEQVKAAMSDWIGLAKVEVTGATDQLISKLESEHGINIDRESARAIFDCANRTIASFSAKSITADR